MQIPKLLFILISIFNFSGLWAQSNSGSNNYLPKTIIIKVKPEYRSICKKDRIENALFDKLYKNIGGSKITKKFPHAKLTRCAENKHSEQFADLTLIYEFNYSANISLEKVIRKFGALKLFEYVEPHYIQHFCYSPNDPDEASQYAIAKINAEAAWGVNNTTAHGDTNVVIGITDTGIEPEHPDLKYNIKQNYADQIDGIDNDGDGYIDNFSGWDLGENDNDPSYNKNAHGVHVAGIAAASTDNGIGIAGIGFNCKFLPVKIVDSAGVITTGYEGIAYAAEHGCAIINCSWGGNDGGKMGQDVITYATINHNALVVAAAGNESSEDLLFPASYKYVISVANTNKNDSLSKSSNYGYSIDVCAPGEHIYSTYPTGSYKIQTGTSMASPCVAGAAAIIKSFFPAYTALQIGEKLKTTCDNIYPINEDIYSDKLGGGRINLYNALTQNTSPAIVMTERNETDNNDNVFSADDTILIKGSYTNFLATASNVVCKLTTTSGFVDILRGDVVLGSMTTLGIANNNASPFKVRVLPNAPSNLPVVFKLTYTDLATAYDHSEYFSIIVNVGYVNIAINDVTLGVSDNGRIGYHEPNHMEGFGFTYKDKGSLFYEAGLMIGTNGTKVSDGIRSSNDKTDNDFQPMISTHKEEPATYSEFSVKGVFNDNSATYPLPIKVYNSAYAWSTDGNRKYVILKYVIKNTGNEDLVNLYAGIFADWDIDAFTYDSNRVSFDVANKMGYAYYTGADGIYAGIKLLSNSAPLVHYAIDHLIGGAGGVDLETGGYDGDEKYRTLSTNRHEAGVNASGNDIMDVVSSGPFIVNPGDSVEVSFALIAGDNLPDIQASAAKAQIKYDSIANILSHDENTITVYPNPSNGSSIVDFYVSEETMVELKIVDIFGQEIAIIVSEKMQAGPHRIIYETSELPSGLYFYQLISGNKRQIKKMVVAK